jgi:hypothetical protein
MVGSTRFQAPSTKETSNFKHQTSNIKHQRNSKPQAPVRAARDPLGVGA